MTVLRSIRIGVAAGSAAMGLDAVLLALLGSPVELDLAVVTLYLLVATAAALMVTAATRFWSLTLSSAQLTATSFAAVYALPVLERIVDLVVRDYGLAIQATVALGAIAALTFWLRAMVRLAGGRYCAGLVTGASATAILLGANRQLVSSALELSALIIDLAVIVAALMTALVVRLVGLRAAMMTVVVVGGLAVMAVWETSRGPEPHGLRRGPTGAHNLVVVVVDTLRADVFEGVLGDTAEGASLRQQLGGYVTFSNCIAASPWTAPSMGSMWTGRYPEEHGFGVHTGDPSRPLRRLDDRLPTLAEVLAGVGFETEALVANTMLHPASGIDRGFRHYEVMLPTGLRFPLISALSRLGVGIAEPYRPARDVAARFESRLERLVTLQRPFFMWVHLMDPHAPYLPNPQLSPESTGVLGGRDATLYRGEVRATLAAVAEMVATLDRWGVLERTVVVVTSDHGEMFAEDEHKSYLKGRDGRPIDQGHGHALYEELIRVPLVVRSPGGAPRPRVRRELLSHVDFPVTFSRLVGTAFGHVDDEAVDFSPLILRGSGASPEMRRRWVFSGTLQAGPVQWVARGRRHKLIEFEGLVHPSELYDLRSDVHERTNIAEVEPGVRRPVERVLREHLQKLEPGPETSAPMLDSTTLRLLEALGYTR